ncbi:alpha-L-fucosidase [Lutibacter citreus]|uniref:alpha-L-fucosidase n=1 Tax=Lutibacter citreus TaxID=2138210 RepID=UPI000DBE2EDE|nr:alpha-L-fucosidase [Lutibacter citreus]
MKPVILFLMLISAVFFVNAQDKYTQDWESLKEHEAAPQWFQDAKVGVYFTWGPYSIPASGGEWYPRWMYTPGINNRGQKTYDYHQKNFGPNYHYNDFCKDWKTPKFNAKEWVDVFEDMGAKYIGAIAEHHDGFSLWDSKVNPWNAKRMGPKIDIIGAISKETRKRGLKFMATFHHGFNMMYYPKPENSFVRPMSRYNMMEKGEFNYPKGGDYDKLYGNLPYKEAQEYWLEKLNEVIDKYSPDYIWMDFGQRFLREEYLKKFLVNYFNHALNNKKEVLVNTKGGFFPTDLAIINIERATLPDISNFTWVSDFKLGANWSYNQFNRTALNPQKALRILADIVSKNGTMIFCAAPMANGTIPLEQLKTMKEIGAWLKLYGEAIYETRPFVAYGEGVTKIVNDLDYEWNTYNLVRTGLWDLNSGDIRFTSKGNTVYAIQLGWPGENKTVLMETFTGKAKHFKIKSISLLGSKEKIKWRKTNEGLKVITPSQKPKEADAAIVYKIILK